MNSIEKIKQYKVEIYKNLPDFMIAEFNHENELISEYNGRQLLELLQNADDQGATSVQVELDSKEFTLKIFNMGEPFSEDGFKSLMIPNLSTKKESKFIGNKGLGFRSIINWANRISINSNGVAVKFSREISRTNFDELFGFEQRTSILKSCARNENAVPIAFLALPEISMAPLENWVTEIGIDFKQEFLDDIHLQLELLEPEVLLFLNHIEQIVISIDNSQKIISRSIYEDKITINDETWIVAELTGDLPNSLQDLTKTETQKFNLKIAYTPELDKRSDRLFSFFPTKVSIDFPMIIHGTFDLDSSRNQLVKSNKNVYLLTELVKLISETAKNLSKESVSWKPFKLLQSKHRNNILSELGFYAKIDEFIQSEALFPCVNNSYKKMADVVILGAELPSLVKSANCADSFYWLLDYDACAEYYRLKFKSLSEIIELKSSFNELSKCMLLTDDNYEARAALIVALLSLPIRNSLELLVNDANEIISLDDDAYTPATSHSVSIALPSYANISFLNILLYKALVNRLQIRGVESARELQRRLKDITNIQTYEPAQVIRKIISGARKLIKEDGVSVKSIICEMVTSLYSNYKNFNGLAELSHDVKIPLINRAERVCDSTDLYFGVGYPSGSICEKIFRPIYDDSDFLAAPEFYGNFDGSPDGEDLENFFHWLGVNRFVKYIKGSISSKSYEEYVFSNVRTPAGYRDYRSICDSLDPSFVSSLKHSIEKEKILAWIAFDIKAIRSLGLENDDVFNYSRAGELQGKFYYSLNRKPSYISFQLAQLALFDNYLITDDVNIEFLNEIHIDFENEIFDLVGASRRDVENILLSLGAKSRFEDLSIERVRRVISTLPDTNSGGKQTQKIYKLALDHFEENKLPLDMEIMLFAKKGGEEGYFSQDEVFYADNIKLPRKLVASKAVINLPRRQGNNKVLKFFGIRDLNATNLGVRNFSSIPTQTSALRIHFDAIKPYLLAYRIANIQKEKNVHAINLNKIEIILCSDILASVDDVEVNLDENDYIVSDSRFYVKIDEHKQFIDLKGDPNFCDVFSQIIGSVFLVVDNLDKYRSVFKDSRNDVEHVIAEDIGLEVLSEARRLLGLSDHFASFWSTVMKCAQSPLTVNCVEAQLDCILSGLNLGHADIADLNYSDLSKPSSAIAASNILEKLGISISNFNSYAFYKIDLSGIHAKLLIAKFLELFNSFKFSLWNVLCESEWSERKKFLNYQAIYEHSREYVISCANKYKDTTDVNYKNMVLNFIRENFNNLNLLEFSEFNHVFIRQSELVSVEEVGRLPPEFISCLYFEDGLEEVMAYFNEIEMSSLSDEISIDQNEDIFVRSVTATGHYPTLTPKPIKRPYKHTQTIEVAKKQSGDSAEDLVYNYLLKSHGKQYVEYVSKRDDSLGYDLRYSADGGKSWRFVEIKRYTSNCFYISSNELSFYKDNVDSYELFLVSQDDNIYILTDLDFYNGEKFNLIPEKYRVECILT